MSFSRNHKHLSIAPSSDTFLPYTLKAIKKMMPSEALYIESPKKIEEISKVKDVLEQQLNENNKMPRIKIIPPKDSEMKNVPSERIIPNTNFLIAKKPSRKLIIKDSVKEELLKKETAKKPKRNCFSCIIDESKSISPLRNRRFDIHINCKLQKLDGYNVTQINPTFIKEKKIQTFILQDELKVLEDKIFQLTGFLRVGARLNTQEVILGIPIECLISLNEQIEELCGLIYNIGQVLLQEYKSKSHELNIEDIKARFDKMENLKSEQKNFWDLMKILASTSVYLKECSSFYRSRQRSIEGEGLPANLFSQVIFTSYKARLLVSTIDNEYQLYESNVASIKLRKSQHSPKQKSKKGKVTLFERLSLRTMSQPKKAHPKRKPLLQSIEENYEQRQKAENEDDLKSVERAISENLHKIFPPKPTIVGIIKRNIR